MIQSHLIQNVADQVTLLYYDSVLDGKHVLTGCGVGRVREGDAEITPTAQQTLMRLLNHAKDTHGEQVAVRLQEIGTVQAAHLRIRKALEAANEKEVVFFVCRGPEVYDAAVAALNVQWVRQTGVQ